MRDRLPFWLYVKIRCSSKRIAPSGHEDTVIVTCYVSASASGNRADRRERLVIVRLGLIVVNAMHTKPDKCEITMKALNTFQHQSLKQLRLAAVVIASELSLRMPRR